MRNKIFISYSHQDEVWVNEFYRMMAPALLDGAVVLWSDREIAPGKNWQNEITLALDSACIALLAISDHFLASEFIMRTELPYCLNSRNAGQIEILWCLLAPCLFERTAIASLQALHALNKPFSILSRSEHQQRMKDVAIQILKVYSKKCSPTLSQIQKVDGPIQETKKIAQSKCTENVSKPIDSRSPEVRKVNKSIPDAGLVTRATDSIRSENADTRDKDKKSVVIRLEGEIDRFETPNLSELLRPSIKAKCSLINIDMTDVSYIDSNALAVLIETFQRVRKYGGKLMLTNLRPGLRPIFEIAKLDWILESP